jgi:hypothetical protein
MNKKSKNGLEEVIASANTLAAYGHYGIVVNYDYYGTPVPYDEERDRWTLAPIEPASQAKPVIRATRINKSMPPEVVKVKQERRRFWFKLFGQKA